MALDLSAELHQHRSRGGVPAAPPLLPRRPLAPQPPKPRFDERRILRLFPQMRASLRRPHPGWRLTEQRGVLSDNVNVTTDGGLWRNANPGRVVESRASREKGVHVDYAQVCRPNRIFFFGTTARAVRARHPQDRRQLRRPLALAGDRLPRGCESRPECGSAVRSSPCTRSTSAAGRRARFQAAPRDRAASKGRFRRRERISGIPARSISATNERCCLG